MQKHHFYPLSVKFSLPVPLSVSTSFHPGCQETTINASLVSRKFVWKKLSEVNSIGNWSFALWGEDCEESGAKCVMEFDRTLQLSFSPKLGKKTGTIYNKCIIMKLNWDLRWSWNKYVRRYYDREKMAALGWIYCAGGWSTMGRLLGRMDRGPESPGYGGIIQKWNIGTASICWQW